MTPVYDFAQCLNRLMRKHSLTIATLSAHTGSRAELRHILQGGGTDARRQHMYQRLIASGLFDSGECEELTQAMQASRVGMERYVAQLNLERLIHGDSTPREAEIQIVDGPLLSERIRVLAQADEVEILCFNSCFPALYDVLAPLFSDSKRQVSMRHYIRLGENGNDAAKAIGCVSKLLFDKRYQPFALPEDSRADNTRAVDGSFLSIRFRRGARSGEQFYAVMNNTTVYELSGASHAGIQAFLSRILQDYAAGATPLKALQSMSTDYASLMMACLSRELNRTTYYLCSDFVFIQTPPAIVEEAFREGTPMSEEQFAAARSSLLPLYEQRYQNFYYKKRPTYSINTPDGCRRFMETGRHSDHFLGFRAYTPQERLAVLENVIRKADECPNYIPLMARNEADIGQYMLIGYEKQGVLVTLLDSDYNVREGYDYLYLTYPPFVELFIEYVQNQLIQEGCHSREETLQILQALYDEYSEKFQQ